jgi:hypothetical protein
MESAFGIDHGYEDIAKFGFAGLGAKIGQKTAQAGQGLRRIGAQNMANSRQTSKMPGMGGMGRMGQRAGATSVRQGGMLRGLGQRMQKRPGLTGGLAAGGAAAGVGGAGGALMNRNKRF